MKLIENLKQKRLSKAQATLALMVAITIVMIEVSVLISTISLSHFYNIQDADSATNALTLMDSGFEEALYRLRLDSSYSGGTITTPAGSAIIGIIPSGSNRIVHVTTLGTDTYRQLSATITADEIVTNPLEEFGMFGGDRQYVEGNAVFYGDVRANDNLWVRDNATVYGNLVMSGDGAQSDTRVRNNGSVRGNPLTTVLEGYIYSVDDVRLQNNGYVQRDIYSEKRVISQQSSSYGGTAYQYQDLDLDPIPVPQFDFDEWKAVAQVNGTYYSNASQFLNYLSLNGNVISGGVHFIDTTSNITIPAGQNFNITGSIISRGAIEIRANNYTQVRDPAYDHLAVLVSDKSITITDASNCNCKVNINGAIYAYDDVSIARATYSGSFPAITIDGVIWAGDDITIGQNTEFTYDEDVATIHSGGFEFSGGGTGISNITISSWSIQ